MARCGRVRPRAAGCVRVRTSAHPCIGRTLPTRCTLRTRVHLAHSVHQVRHAEARGAFAEQFV